MIFSPSGRKNRFWFVILFLTVLMVGLSAQAQAGPEKTIKIGIIGPMKLIYGYQIWQAAEIAAEEINAAGGVLLNGVKHKIELIKADDNCFVSVVDAANAMEKLVTVDKVSVVIGGVRSEAVLAQQEIMADNKIVYLSTGSGSPRVVLRVAKNYNRYKYFFRAGLSGLWTSHLGRINVEMAGRKMKELLGIDKPKVALLCEKIVVWEPLIKAVPGLLKKMGMEYVGVWQPSAMATDVRAEMEAIESSGAHIIYQMLSSPVGIAVSRQYGELQIPAVAAGINVSAGRYKHYKDTKGACEYQCFGSPYGFAQVTDKTIPFVEKFFNRHHEIPQWVAQSYDTLYFVKEAIERAGSLDSDKLVAALEKTDYVGAQGRIAFTPMGSKYPHEFTFGPEYLTWLGAQWQGDKQVVIWPDGNAALGDQRFKGLKYKGSGEYKLPPWVVEYWKKNK